jgi:hypothetical protein
MNLRPAHILSILMGMLIGASIGYFVTFFLKPGTFPEIEKTTGLRGAGVLAGSIAGAAACVLTLLFRAARSPDEEPSRNFTSINGIGSTLIGKNDVRPDGSYLTTEWFIVLFVPIFPVCRYRVSPRGRQSYAIHSKQPPTLRDAIKVYARTILIIGCIVVAVFVLKKLFPS